MAFERKELNENLINSGEKYKNGDALQASAINEIVGGVLNLQEKDSGGKLYRHTVVSHVRDKMYHEEFDVIHTFYDSNPNKYTFETYSPKTGDFVTVQNKFSLKTGYGYYTNRNLMLASIRLEIFMFDGTSLSKYDVDGKGGNSDWFSVEDTVEEL